MQMHSNFGLSHVKEKIILYRFGHRYTANRIWNLDSQTQPQPMICFAEASLQGENIMPRVGHVQPAKS